MKNVETFVKKLVALRGSKNRWADFFQENICASVHFDLFKGISGKIDF